MKSTVLFFLIIASFQIAYSQSHKSFVSDPAQSHLDHSWLELKPVVQELFIMSDPYNHEIGQFENVPRFDVSLPYHDRKLADYELFRILTDIRQEEKEDVKRPQEPGHSDIGHYLQYRDHRLAIKEAILGGGRITEMTKMATEDAEIKQKLDSIIEENYFRWRTGWQVESKYLKILNDSNQLVEVSSQYYDNENERLYISFKDVITYDSNQKTRLSYTSYRWDSDEERLLPYRKTEYSYGDGLNITYTYYIWNGEFERWELENKADYTYENEILETMVISVWDTITKDWIKSERSDYSYNESNLLETIFGFVWDTITKDWIQSEKEERSYNDSNQIVSNLTMVWDRTGNVWIHGKKEESLYNESGKLIEYKSYIWDVENNMWIGIRKTEWDFNEAGLTIDYSYHVWDTDSATWITLYQYLNEYNEDDLMTTFQSSSWNSDSLKVIPSSKNEYSYNEDLQNDVEFVFRWNIYENKWDTISRVEKFYDNAGSLSYSLEYQMRYNGWSIESKIEYAAGENSNALNYIRYTWNGYDWVTDYQYKEFWDGDYYNGYERSSWKWDLRGWENTSEKYTYSEEGIVTRVDYVQYNSDMTVKYTFRDEYSFNVKGLIDTVKSWYDESGRGYITSLEYDEYGNIIAYQESEWSENENDFVMSYRGNIEYDENGNYISFIEQERDDSTGTWINSYKELLTYNENDLLTKIIDQDWDTITGWVDDIKIEYMYDANGNMLTQINYQWNLDSLEWEPESIKEYAYDQKNKKILMENSYWDADADNWYSYDSIIYEYDSEGNFILMINHYWNQDSNAWTQNYKYIYTYDAQNNKISDNYYHYQEYNDTYEHWRQEIYTYDYSFKRNEVLMPFDVVYGSFFYEDDGSEYEWVKEGRIMTVIRSELDYDDTEEMRERNRETYYYSGVQVVRAGPPVSLPEIQIFPNPASNILRIKLGDEKLTRIEVKVFDLSGKVILIESLNQKNLVDISSLKQGMYLIQIKTDDKHYTCKFIKSIY